MNTIISEFQKISVKYDGKTLRQLVGIIDSIYIFVLKASLEDFSKKAEASEKIILALGFTSSEQRSFYSPLIQQAFELCGNRFEYYINKPDYVERAHMYLSDRRDIFAIETFFQVTKGLASGLKIESSQLYGSKTTLKIYVKGHINMKFYMQKAKKVLKGVAFVSTVSTVATSFLPAGVAAGIAAAGTASKVTLSGSSAAQHAKLSFGNDGVNVNMKNLYAHKGKINLYLRNTNAMFERSWLGDYHDEEILLVDSAVSRWQRVVQDSEKSTTKSLRKAADTVIGDEETIVSTIAEGGEYLDTIKDVASYFA